MAVIWEKKTSDKFYEVRSAGRSRRLYTNGVLHTQFNPSSLLTGSVWDLLTMGGFLVPQGRLKRILVLGVGGGAAFHQLEQLFKPEKIVGIELSRVHLSIAKRFFDLDRKPFKLIQGDALKWIEDYQGEPFDLIIDDMFGEEYGEPFRVATPNLTWLKLLNQHLSETGALVLNFDCPKDFNRCADSAALLKTIKSGFRLSTSNCENIVGLFAKEALVTKDIQSRLRQFPQLDTRKTTCKLKYNIRTIKL